MEEFSIPHMLLQVAEALSPLLVALASWAAYQGAAWIRQRVQHDRLRNAADLAAGAVTDTVAATSTAALEAFRAAAEDGEITREEMIEIRDAALKSAKSHLGKSAMTGLKYLTDDPDEWLWTKIKAEAKVQDAMMGSADVYDADYEEEDDPVDYDG